EGRITRVCTNVFTVIFLPIEEKSQPSRLPVVSRQQSLSTNEEEHLEALRLLFDPPLAQRKCLQCQDLLHLDLSIPSLQSIFERSPKRILERFFLLCLLQ